MTHKSMVPWQGQEKGSMANHTLVLEMSAQKQQSPLILVAGASHMAKPELNRVGFIVLPQAGEPSIYEPHNVDYQKTIIT